MFETVKNSADVSRCRREDGNFEEKVGMKTNLQPLFLQGKLVMLTF